jgi:hypothetical protein
VLAHEDAQRPEGALGLLWIAVVALGAGMLLARWL